MSPDVNDPPSCWGTSHEWGGVCLDGNGGGCAEWWENRVRTRPTPMRMCGNEHKHGAHMWSGGSPEPNGHWGHWGCPGLSACLDPGGNAEIESMALNRAIGAGAAAIVEAHHQTTITERAALIGEFPTLAAARAIDAALPHLGLTKAAVPTAPYSQWVAAGGVIPTCELCPTAHPQYPHQMSRPHGRWMWETGQEPSWLADAHVEGADREPPPEPFGWGRDG